MSRYLLECEGLVAGYDQPVVGPLDLRIAPGEVVGVFGPNGAGKSTLLRAIAGTARIFAGVCRRRPGLRVALQRQQAVRPEELPLTGADIARVVGANPAKAPPEVKALLHPRLDRLSGGQFQLVQVWSVLAGPAELVLLDEPTNNLDPAVKARLTSLLRTVGEGRGIVVISHEHDFLDMACTRVVEIA